MTVGVKHMKIWNFNNDKDKEQSVEGSDKKIVYAVDYADNKYISVHSGGYLQTTPSAKSAKDFERHSGIIDALKIND